MVSCSAVNVSGFQQYCCVVGDYAYDLLILVFQSLWLCWLCSLWLCCTPVQEGPCSDVLVHAAKNAKLCMSWQSTAKYSLLFSLSNHQYVRILSMYYSNDSSQHHKHAFALASASQKLTEASFGSHRSAALSVPVLPPYEA